MKEILIPLVTLVIGLVVAFPAGIFYRKRVAEAELGSAEEEAKRVLSDAIKPLRPRRERPLSRPRTRSSSCAAMRTGRSRTAATR